MLHHKEIRNLSLSVLVVAILGSLSLLMSYNSHANIAPVGHLISPTNGTTFRAGANGVASFTFVTSATDPDPGARVRTQVAYRKVGETRWHTFGTSAAQGPDGTATIPNGITGPFVNPSGWNCAMGWGSRTPPSSCDVIWSNGSRSGKCAWSDYGIYISVSLAPGTYDWTARSYDDVAYSAWPATWRFSITSPPAPPAPPAPPPAPPAVPQAPQNPATGGNNSGSTDYSYSSPGSVDVAKPLEDKEPPTVPADLAGLFAAEDNSIKLSWSAATDNTEVAGYEVERQLKDQNSWQKIADSSLSEYTDFNFEPNKLYQYRVRAYDQVKNYSSYSNVADVLSGDFTPNVTPGDGGKIQDNNAKILLEFEPGSVDDDLFITIEKSDQKFTVESGKKIVGDIFEVKAKNRRGEEVHKFKTQVALKFKINSKDTKGTNVSSLRIVSSNDGEKMEAAKTYLDLKFNEAKTLTDHLSFYFLVADKASPWQIFVNILLWIFILILLGVGGYYGYQYYLRQKYQKEHHEDYIYKH